MPTAYPKDDQHPLFVKFHFVDVFTDYNISQNQALLRTQFSSSKDHHQVTVLRRGTIRESQLPHRVGKMLWSYESEIWANRSSAKLLHDCAEFHLPVLIIIDTCWRDGDILKIQLEVKRIH